MIVHAKLCACGCGTPVTGTWSKGHNKRKPPPTLDVLMAATEPNGSCREWQRSRNTDGYGNVWSDGKRWKAHRLAYTLVFGAIPDGLEVCHRCDNPACINVEHLFLGTHLDNMRDAHAKGMYVRRPARDQRGERNAQAKLTVPDVIAIRLRYAIGQTQSAIAAAYGVTQSTVGQIVRGERWKHAPGPRVRRAT